MSRDHSIWLGSCCLPPQSSERVFTTPRFRSSHDLADWIYLLQTTNSGRICGLWCGSKFNLTSGCEWWLGPQLHHFLKPLPKIYSQDQIIKGFLVFLEIENLMKIPSGCTQKALASSSTLLNSFIVEQMCLMYQRYDRFKSCLFCLPPTHLQGITP